MPEFDAGVILGDIVRGLTKFAESTKVIGDPIEAAGKIIVPAVVVRVGFGAGGGSGTKKGEEADEVEVGGGSGGGGGVMLTPVFLIVDDEGERLLTVPKAATAGGSMIDTIKDIVDSIAEGRQEKKAEEEEEAREES